MVSISWLFVNYLLIYVVSENGWFDWLRFYYKVLIIIYVLDFFNMFKKVEGLM